MSYTADAERLMQESHETESWDAIALLEEAQRLADTHRDEELGFEVRRMLIRRATFGGQVEKALVAFAWCLAYLDRRDSSSGHESRALLWEYKWMAGNILDFPSVSRAQINATLEDMTRRYTRAGIGLGAVYQLRSRAAMEMGDREDAEAYGKLAHASQDDDMTDCPACQIDAKTRLLLALDRPEDALREAEPVLVEDYVCAEVPLITYASLLVPLIKLGRVAEAAEYQRARYRQALGDPNFVASLAEHLRFFALVGDTPKGVRLLETKLPWAMQSAVGETRFRFFLGARLTMLRLVHDGQLSVRMRLPPDAPGYREDARYKPADAAAAFLAAAEELAAAFNARNGNDRYSVRIRENDALVSLFIDAPPAAEAEERDARDEEGA